MAFSSVEEHARHLQTSMRALYDCIGSVHCPALGAPVVFNARGFYHLQNDIHGGRRDPKARVYKLALVPLAVPAIKTASQIEEHRELEVQLERRKGALPVLVDYWALVADVGRKRNVRVRVILIKPKNARNAIFWSIMRLKVKKNGTKKAP